MTQPKPDAAAAAAARRLAREKITTDRQQMRQANYVTILRPKLDPEEVAIAVIGSVLQNLWAVLLIRKLFPGKISRRRAYGYVTLTRLLQNQQSQYLSFTKKRPKGI